MYFYIYPVYKGNKSKIMEILELKSTISGIEFPFHRFKQIVYCEEIIRNQ